LTVASRRLYRRRNDRDEGGIVKRCSLAFTLAAAIAVFAPGIARAVTFSNPTPITVPAAGDKGPGAPYPSTISVAGVPGAVVAARATLVDVSQPFNSQHIQALLVAPGGQLTVLISGCGSTSPMSGQTFTFDDAAPTALVPDSSKPCVGGTYRPTPSNFGEFEPPAPPGFHQGAMSALNGSPANGTWQLFANDYVGGDTQLGSIGGGWSIDLLTNATPTNASPTTTTTCRGKPATMTGTGGDDTLVGTERADVIVGSDGRDVISGLAGNDTICGGNGKDTLKGGKNRDILLGQKGKDRLQGGGARDICKGGKGADSAKCEVEKSI
jgi:Ca2+-binding RTX toxin-like protein